MAIARSHIIDPANRVVAHCISRCVRQLFLLKDKRRRRAIVDRLRFLSTHFAIDVLEFAVLSNHLHLVVATHPELAKLWSDEEVATRYRSLCPDHRWRSRNRISKALPAQPEEIAAAMANPTLIGNWRDNLASLSSFHKLLKQKFARDANRADDVTGHYWEGRFKSIVALDEPAIIAHMVYVALNPVRAAMAAALDEYEFASVADRVKQLKRRIAAGEFAGEARQARQRLRDAQLVPTMPCDPGPAVRRISTLPGGTPNPWFGGAVPAIVEGSSLAAFLHDVDAEGRSLSYGKAGIIPESTPPVLSVLEAALARFAGAELAMLPPSRAARSLVPELDRALARTRGGSAWGNLSGSARSLALYARSMGRQFVVGILGRSEDGGVRRVRAASAPRDDPASSRRELAAMCPLPPAPPSVHDGPC